MNDVLGRLGAGESTVSIINGDKTLSLENTGNGLQVGRPLPVLCCEVPSR